MVPNVHLSSAPIEKKIGSPKSGEVDLWESPNHIEKNQIPIAQNCTNCSILAVKATVAGLNLNVHTGGMGHSTTESKKPCMA